MDICIYIYIYNKAADALDKAGAMSAEGLEQVYMHTL